SGSLTGTKWMTDFEGKEYGVGRYDYGRRIMFVFNNYFTKSVLESPSSLNGSGLAPFNGIERDIMWVSVPMPKQRFQFTRPDQMPSDVRFQINVSKPYRYGWSGVVNIAVPTASNAPYTNFNKLI